MENTTITNTSGHPSTVPLSAAADSATTNNARIVPAPQQVTLASSSPPKKSARLAEKRKLREEIGPVSTQDEEFYFTPLKSSRLSSPLTVTGENQIKNTGNDAQSSVHPLNLADTVANEETEKSGNFCNGEDDVQQEEVMGSKLGTIGFADDSSEEDKWFNSLDVGKLEDNIVEIDDISTTGGRLLTERQKSFIFKQDTGFSIDRMEEESSDLQLPKELAQTVSSRCTNGRTRKEKSERRRVLAQQKKEYDKKRTVERLLKKSNHVTKSPKSSSSAKPRCKVSGPLITYTIREHGNFISFPNGTDISVFGGVPSSKKTTEVPRPQDPVFCGIQGCLKPKKYTCSKTKIPICSLECYKQNLLLKPS